MSKNKSGVPDRDHPKFTPGFQSVRDGFSYKAASQIAAARLGPVANSKKVTLVRPDTALVSRNVSLHLLCLRLYFEGSFFKESAIRFSLRSQNNEYVRLTTTPLLIKYRFVAAYSDTPDLPF